jgi:hypothetical protein
LVQLAKKPIKLELQNVVEQKVDVVVLNQSQMTKAESQAARKNEWT